MNYRITVAGHLDPSCSEWFDGLTIDNLETGDTVLAGPVIDQAELHGLLAKIRDLGLALVAVQQEEIGAPTRGPQRLYPMRVASGTVPLLDGRALSWPVVCYLVETVDGKHVLIDSGQPGDFRPQAGIPVPKD